MIYNCMSGPQPNSRHERVVNGNWWVGRRTPSKLRLGIVLLLAFGLVATNMEVPPASASAGMTLDVDNTPDSTAVATEETPGN